MSDFLSRLVGRSLGLSEAVQPRVPSLYEPYRKGNGPLWARHDVEGQDERRASRNEVSLGREPGAEDDKGHPSVLRPMEPSRHTRQVQPAEFVNEPAAPVLQSVAEVTEKALASETGSGPVLLTERLQHTEVATVGEALSNNPVPVRSSTEPPGSIPSTATRPSTLVRPASRPRAASNPENAGRLAVELRGAQLGGQSLIVQLAKSHAAIRSDPPTPSLMPAAKPGMLVVSSASRPQRPEGPDVTNVQAPPYSALASEPSIRVSIGRVDVRAVFPTPPPRRAQTARPKPGLSLDEYLKRRNRGQQ